MNIRFKPSFAKLFRKLDRTKQEQAVKTIEELKNVFGTGRTSEGLGLKRLSRTIWEARTSLKDRILFTAEEDTIVFILIGSHDDISKYLKNL